MAKNQYFCLFSPTEILCHRRPVRPPLAFLVDGPPPHNGETKQRYGPGPSSTAATAQGRGRTAARRAWCWPSSPTRGRSGRPEWGRRGPPARDCGAGVGVRGGGGSLWVRQAAAEAHRARWAISVARRFQTLGGLGRVALKQKKFPFNEKSTREIFRQAGRFRGGGVISTIIHPPNTSRNEFLKLLKKLFDFVRSLDQPLAVPYVLQGG